MFFFRAEPIPKMKNFWFGEIYHTQRLLIIPQKGVPMSLIDN